MVMESYSNNLYFCTATSYHPITITQLSDTSTIPYHLPQLLPSHLTHHVKTSYHPNTIPSVSHMSHVHATTTVYHPKSSIRSLLREVPTRLPTDHSFPNTAHRYINHLQTWRTLPPSASASLPDHSHLRTCKLPQCLLLAPLRLQLLLVPLRLQLLLTPRLAPLGPRQSCAGLALGRTRGSLEFGSTSTSSTRPMRSARTQGAMCGDPFLRLECFLPAPRCAARASGVHGTGEQPSP